MYILLTALNKPPYNSEKRISTAIKKVENYKNVVVVVVVVLEGKQKKYGEGKKERGKVKNCFSW